MRLRILIVAEFSPLGDNVIEGLFAAGHEIVEVWYGSGSATLKPSKQRRLERQIARKIARLQKGRQFTFRDVGGTSHQDRLALLDTLQNVPGLVSAGSGIIFKQDFLDRFDVAVNFHPAMLPDYRGPHPLQALVLRGDADRFGGMTMHLLAVGIDEGAIVAQQHIPRSSARHSLDWRLKLSAAAGRMARDDLAALIAGEIDPRPQSGGSYVRLEANELLMNPTWTFEMAERVLVEAGSFGIKQLADPTGEGPSLFVCGTPKNLGRPTGETPRIGVRSVDFDLVDARVRLTRERRPERWRRRFFRARDRLLNGARDP